MPRPLRLAFAFLPAMVLAFAGLARIVPAADDAATEVKLVPVKWDEYRSRLEKNPTKAKLTLVDAWASNCGPCRENFPHLLEMDRKYASKGLNVVSLTLDDISDPKALAEAKKFLTESKSTITNLLMDEEFGVGFEKLNISAIPAVFIYGPDGKELKRFALEDASNPFTYEQVEKEVVALLSAAK